MSRASIKQRVSNNLPTDFDFKGYELKKYSIKAASMPSKSSAISARQRIKVVAVVLGAIFIVALYIGLPLAVALHSRLFPYIQDIIIATYLILQVGLLMIYTIKKTDGR